MTSLERIENELKDHKVFITFMAEESIKMDIKNRKRNALISIVLWFFIYLLVPVIIILF